MKEKPIYINIKGLMGVLLSMLIFISSVPMTAMAAEPGDTVSGKTVVYFVSDSEAEGIPFEELVSGMEDYMEDSGTEALFPQEEPYDLQYEPEAYASLEDIAGEVLGSDESLAYRETRSAVIVTGVETAEQVEKEGIWVTEDGDEVSIRINTYQEVGISQKEGQTDDSLPSEGGAVPSGEETGIQDEAEEQTNTAEATGDETAASGSRTGTLISSIKTEPPSVASGPGNLFKMYYGVSTDAYGTVTVVGPDGRTVKTLYDDFLHKQGYYLLTWDLREADGTYAAEGRYTVKLEFRTPGGKVDTGELSFDIAGLTLSSVKGDRTEMTPGETLTFYYQIGRAAKGTIGVYNESGEEVRNIYNEFQHAAGYYKAVWNGKDSSGTPVPEGTYTVRIAFGNVKAELAVTVGRSNQLSPVLSSVKLEKGTVDLTKGETVKFYYGLSEAVAGDITVYNSTGGEVAKLYDDFSHSAGYYAALWNGKDKNGMPVSSGEYTIRLEFKGDRKELKVTVRNEAIPGQDFELSGIKVAESPLYWGETAKVYYNLTGDSIGTVTIKNEEGETVKTLYDAFAHAKGYYAVNWNLKDESGEYVPAGKYTVEFIFTSGNYRKEGKTELQIEGQKSNLALSNVKASLKEIGPAINSVDIFYSVSEKSEGTVKIHDAAGNVVRTFYDSFTHGSGYYKITWDLKNSKGERVPEGDYVVEFVFDDGIKSVEADLELEVVGNFALTHVYMTPARVNVSCDESVKLNYCITEGSIGTIRIYNSEGQIVHTFYDSFYHSAGYYAAVWNLRDGNGNLVPLGWYEVRMEFSKPDGSKIDKSVTFELVDELALTSIKTTPSQPAKGEAVRLYYLTTKDSYGTIRVYDKNGKVIRSWYSNTYHAAGYYSVIWDQKDTSGRQVEAGTYTFELCFNDESTSIVKTISVQVQSETIIDRKIKEIRGYTWVPYQYGGTSTLGWDCSGFTQWALNYMGVNIPRTTYEQAVGGSAISVSNRYLWQPGDILCYSSGGSIEHVALYLGDGMLMHALNPKYGTLIQSVDYYEKWDSSNYLVGVRRYL